MTNIKKNKVDRICPECNQSFTAKRSDVNRGWAVSCSKKCAAKRRERRNYNYLPLIGVKLDF